MADGSREWRFPFRLSNRQLNVLKALGIILSLYFFLVGIKGIGEGFKLFGREFAESILTSTADPLVGLFIGILSTALVQSSSTTTSIIVGLVAGGGISLQGAIPMIMGANIGTTVTNSIVSLGHIGRKEEFQRAFAAATVHDFFNVLAVLLLFPLEMATGAISRVAAFLAHEFEMVGGLKMADPLQYTVKPIVKAIEGLTFHNPWLMVLVSVLITFYMLFLIVKLLRSLVLDRIEAFFDTYIFKTALRAFLFGMLLTFSVQSSSVTTSLVIPLAGAGVLTILQIFPYTIGSNIGTTITANLAAFSTGSEAAVTVALAHLMFNIYGGLLIWPFPPVRRIPVWMAQSMARLAIRNRLIPFFFIILLFFVIPILVILLGGGGVHA